MVCLQETSRQRPVVKWTFNSSLIPTNANIQPDICIGGRPVCVKRCFMVSNRQTQNCRLPLGVLWRFTVKHVVGHSDWQDVFNLSNLFTSSNWILKKQNMLMWKILPVVTCSERQPQCTIQTTRCLHLSPPKQLLLTVHWHTLRLFIVHHFHIDSN